jgi:hypothetical protein
MAGIAMHILFMVLKFTSTLPLQKDDLTKLYSQAISEYIIAVNKEDQSTFDTLFIGKHHDFPEIKLPGSIQNTKISLLAQGEADKKLHYRKSLVYLNMISTITKEKTVFRIVTFIAEKSTGRINYWPKHNCAMEFRYNQKKKELELRKVKFEYPYLEHH